MRFLFQSLAGTVTAACLLLTAQAASAQANVAALLGAAKTGAVPARVAAIDEIATHKEAAAPAVPTLVELLKDPSPDVRAHAAHALGEIGEAAKPAAPALALLLKDSDQTVRRQVIKAFIGIRPGPQVVIPLFISLMEDPDPGVKQRVLRSISEAGAPVVPGLLEAMKNEKAVYWACLILREMGTEGKDAVPALTELLKSPRPEVRREAALALGAMQGAAANSAGPLAALLDDAEAQEAATFALGQIGRLPVGTESKIRANAKSNNKVLSTISLWTIARLHPTDDLAKEAAEQLISRLADKDPFVRSSAAQALVGLKLNPEITFPIYERVLATADDETIRLSLEAMASQGTRALPRLIYALKRDNLRLPAIYLLGRMGPEAASAAGPLATLVGDKNSKVASEAALSLAKIGPAAQTSIPKLIEALETPECESSHAIIYALGRFGPAATPVKDSLFKRLGDPGLAVISAWALAQIDGANPDVSGKILPVLASGMKDASAETRQLSVEALGKVKSLSPNAIAALERAAQDSHQGVREAAAEALKSARGGGAK